VANARVLRVALVLGVAVALPAPAEDDEESREGTIDLQCRITCSVDQPGVPVAELTWSSPRDNRLKGLAAQQVHATVYKDGFEKGNHVVVEPTGAGQEFQPAARGKKLPPGLKLRTTAVEGAVTRGREPPSRTTIKVEGLEPGLNYFWRVSSRAGSQVVNTGAVRCKVPVCPVDRDARLPQR